MTITFSIKRIRSSGGVLQEDLESSPCKFSFSKSNPSSEHQRRSSLSAIFQYCFRISTNEQQKHSSAFENDALFERYRYRQQQKRAPVYVASSPSRSPARPSVDNDTKPRRRPPLPPSNDNRVDDDDGDEDNEPPPRVICRPEEKRATSILINKHNHHRHRHTSSLQTTTAPPMASHQQHRRSRTATHIRHFSASNITTHSEDLTAKEFADIAGIRILPDDVDTTEHHPQPMLPTPPANSSGLSDNTSISCNMSSHILLPHTTSSRHQHHPSGVTINTTTMTTTTNTTYSSGVITPLTREDSPSSAADEKQPHIWDDAFWRNPDRAVATGYYQSRQQQQRQGPQKNAEDNLDDDNMPPVLLEMRQRKSFVIKRGRFEVHFHEAPSTSTPAT
ncbi:hypothetical protein BX666DRAFT_1971981 [Dichotomocladium elegans]|nr:hypothetical protein BX666DRAFT_1971981 [Dichotomocladium elegans]